MNEQNLEYLKERLFYLGFAEKLNKDLETHISAGKEQFQIPFRGEFKNGEKTSVVEYSIDFSKSKTQDMYFLNKYQATLKNEDPAKERSQTFYINKGNGVAAKEAFNMLEGRAVLKTLFKKDEGEKYQAWQQIDFSQKDKHNNHMVNSYHSAYGFDLEKSVLRHPIKELTSVEATADILKSLQKGNRPRVTIEKDGKDEKMFLEASPRERRVHVYDESGRRQFQGVREHKGEKSEEKQSNGQDQSQGKKEKSQKQEVEGDPEASTRKSRRKGVSI
jgi:hypothetical protein